VRRAICYADFFAEHTAALARQGAELLVNVSNDSWFGGEMPARHHFAIARLRSVETRLPQVRATDTGYSALVLPTGEVAVRTAHGETAALSVSVPITPGSRTLIERWGDWFGPAAAILATTGLLLLRRHRRHAP
jgi:apolipoprotein N-acyltransferase